jgi:hypothetical protein
MLGWSYDLRRPDTVFRVQLAVSAVGLVLSAGMLIAGRDPAVYLPVVTSIVGYWLPAPSKAQQGAGAVPTEGCASTAASTAASAVAAFVAEPNQHSAGEDDTMTRR